MNKTLAAALAIGIAFTQPLYAQRTSIDPELALWVERIELQLDENLERTARPVRDSTGTVMLKFNCSESGKATNVAIARSSGNQQIDRAAIRAVEMVKSFHPLPRGLTHNQPIMAMLSYSGSDQQDRRNRAETRRIADAGNLWYRSDRYAYRHQELQAR